MTENTWLSTMLDVSLAFLYTEVLVFVQQFTFPLTVLGCYSIPIQVSIVKPDFDLRVRHKGTKYIYSIYKKYI